MRNLLQSNVYKSEEVMIIMGTCLKDMQNDAYKKLAEISENIFEVCLEETHLNMVITKIIGMLTRKEIKRVIFATVDKSPHCIQLHYIIKELEKINDFKNIEFENYVAVNDEIIKIPEDVISISKNLSKLKERLNEG